MAEDAASFNTEMLSISFGLSKSISPSTPSIRIYGSALLDIVPSPLILIEVLLLPGCPLDCVILTPGSIPCNPELTFMIGRFSKASCSMELTAPVRLTFF